MQAREDEISHPYTFAATLDLIAVPASAYVIAIGSICAKKQMGQICFVPIKQRLASDDRSAIVQGSPALNLLPGAVEEIDVHS